MHRTGGLLAGLIGLLLASAPGPVFAQGGTMANVDLSSPKMAEAELTREDVLAVLEAATPGPPSALVDKSLNGLDLSGLDFSGIDLSRARLNRANLKGTVFKGAILDLAWMIDADLEGADLRDASKATG